MLALLAWGIGQGAADPSRAPSLRTSAALHRDPRPSSPRQTKPYAPLRFELNEGQFQDTVKAVCRTREGTFFLAGDDSAASVGSGSATVDASPGLSLVGHGSLRMRLIGARADARPKGLDPLPGTSNYFIGSDRARWRTGVRTFGGLTFEGVYPGIDLVLRADNGDLEYDFVVAPGHDVGQIALEFSGMSALEVDGKGDLAIELQAGTLKHRTPTIYQTTPAGGRNEVSGAYVLERADRIRFEVGDYDPTRPLVIDPTIVYSTYLGGRGDEGAWDMAVDASGNCYVVGTTNSFDYPTKNTLTEQPGSRDVIVTKLNAEGSDIFFSTYYGGTESDKATAIALDSRGNIYISGETWSRDFPIVGPIQVALRGATDAFVAKLDPSGSRVLYSTYLGGRDFDKVHGIAVDGTGSAFVTGTTWSTDFPTANPLQEGNGGKSDCFVAKLEPDGRSLVFSTYVGGVDAENHGLGPELPHGTYKRLGAIAVDAAGNAYVGGCTASPDFPIANALQERHRGGRLDGYVFKLNAAGSGLLYSTYLGGSGEDIVLGVAVDAYDNAHVTGVTFSEDFPVTDSAYATRSAGGAADAFVAKLDAKGKRLVYSTFLGGSAYEEGHDIAVDPDGNAYITGTTESRDFPVLRSVQPVLAGKVDAFIAKLNPTGSNLISTSYLGGAQVENGGLTGDVALGPTGDVYVTGATNSIDVMLIHPLQPWNNGGEDDIFIFRLSDRQPTLRARVGWSDSGAGDTLVAEELRLVNPNSSSVTVRVAAWITIPRFGTLTILDVGVDGSLLLPANLDVNLGPLECFTVSGDLFPRGEWSIGTRIIDPHSGEILSEGRYPFLVR